MEVHFTPDTEAQLKEFAARRGKEAKNIAKTAAARHLLTAVFYAMRDGHVRSLAAHAAAPDAA
jgi:uncharacterized protein (DUF2267 family)